MGESREDELFCAQRYTRGTLPCSPDRAEGRCQTGCVDGGRSGILAWSAWVSGASNLVKIIFAAISMKNSLLQTLNQHCFVTTLTKMPQNHL
jgi:hypothetical protein